MLFSGDGSLSPREVDSFRGGALVLSKSSTDLEIQVIIQRHFMFRYGEYFVNVQKSNFIRVINQAKLISHKYFKFGRAE